MKTIIIFLALIGSATASTSLENFFNSPQAEKICQTSMIHQGNYSKKFLKFIAGDNEEVYFAFNKGNMSKVLRVNLNDQSEKTFEVEGKIQDILIKGEEVFYLTKNTLYITDRSDGSLVKRMKTLPSNLAKIKYGYARGVFVENNTIYFAHGEHGVVVYDREYDKFIGQLMPSIPQPNSAHRSMVTDIEGNGGKLYFTYDDITLSRDSKAFEGLAIWDINLKKLHKLIPVKQTQEGYYMSNLAIDSNELIISNLNLNFRHKLGKLESDRYMRPLQRIWKYPKGELIGRALINNKTIYGCFNNVHTEELSAGLMKY